ncbi:hypothetical protein M1L60_18985 [Actinoplanes sp. TRM 88003]|uniref:Uncharacterized protein n=1 Tax=Paractinoplanes aksuensis TaxID=2939490 RepID=A0ABT1DPB5_9ACTN|nr:hypothetical protein [Actinoplanes aksuensis]MCO8272682.1 hypothetical protein [Actinoplanes aksuensis]
MGARNSEVEQLLYDLCVGKGFCLPLAESQRLVETPPPDVDGFTDAVLAAEGYGDMSYTDTRRMVREVVDRHMRNWS